MTAPRRARRTDGGGGGGAGGALAGTATLRGGLLIGAAVVLGVVLLGKGFDSGFLPSSSNDPSDEVATGNDDEGTDEGDGDDATTTTAPEELTHAPGEVRVQVLNSAGPQGSAAAATSALSAATYNVFEAETATDRNATASAVYAVSGYEADARQIATTLGITAEPQAMPATPPAPAPPEAQVVVVLGPEFTPPT